MLLCSAHRPCPLTCPWYPYSPVSAQLADCEFALDTLLENFPADPFPRESGAAPDSSLIPIAIGFLRCSSVLGASVGYWLQCTCHLAVS